MTDKDYQYTGEDVRPKVLRDVVVDLVGNRLHEEGFEYVVDELLKLIDNTEHHILTRETMAEIVRRADPRSVKSGYAVTDAVMNALGWQ